MFVGPKVILLAVFRYVGSDSEKTSVGTIRDAHILEVQAYRRDGITIKKTLFLDSKLGFMA